MSKNLLAALVEEFTPSLEQLGYEIVDLEYVKEGDRQVLRFYIYKEGGIGIDDCEAASNLIDARLDELDLIKKSYYLEVSSPDLNRPLKTDRDLERNLGEMVDVKFYKAVDGQKVVRGTLAGFDEEEIELELEEERRRRFVRKDIASIKPAIVF